MSAVYENGTVLAELDIDFRDWVTELSIIGMESNIEKKRNEASYSGYSA
jgi:hypothetical protein